MIGIFHIRNLQPRLPFFSRNTRFRRISRYKFLLSAKDLCHQFFKIPFSGILSCIQRTPIKADSPSQKVVGTPIRTVLVKINHAGLKVIVLKFPISDAYFRPFIGQKRQGYHQLDKTFIFRVKRGLIILRKEFVLFIIIECT